MKISRLITLMSACSLSSACYAGGAVSTLSNTVWGEKTTSAPTVRANPPQDPIRRSPPRASTSLTSSPPADPQHSSTSSTPSVAIPPLSSTEPTSFASVPAAQSSLKEEEEKKKMQLVVVNALTFSGRALYFPSTAKQDFDIEKATFTFDTVRICTLVSWDASKRSLPPPLALNFDKPDSYKVPTNVKSLDFHIGTTIFDDLRKLGRTLDEHEPNRIPSYSQEADCVIQTLEKLIAEHKLREGENYKNVKIQRDRNTGLSRIWVVLDQINVIIEVHALPKETSKN